MNQVVNPAPLTITASAQTKVYGAALPTLTYKVSGFVNNDTSSILSGSPSLTTATTASSGVGSYGISVALGTLAAAPTTTSSRRASWAAR